MRASIGKWLKLERKYLKGKRPKTIGRKKRAGCNLKQL
jgi:hypothetical protein